MTSNTARGTIPLLVDLSPGEGIINRRIAEFIDHARGIAPKQAAAPRQATDQRNGRERLAACATIEATEATLAELLARTKASGKTKRRWEKLAQARIAALKERP